MPVPAKITFYQLNDQYLELDGLSQNQITSSGVTVTPVNSATVTATLYDSTNTVVANFNAIPLSYVSGSSGTYVGQVPNSFDPALLGSGYTLFIDAVFNSLKLHLEVKAAVVVRRT